MCKGRLHFIFSQLNFDKYNNIWNVIDDMQNLVDIEQFTVRVLEPQNGTVGVQ